MVADLTFDPVRHRYELGGRRLPSVTEILGILTERTFAEIPPDQLENARRRGTLVHTAVDLYNRDELDETSVSAEISPYLDAWKRFLSETGAIVIASEMRVHHKKLGYAGTLDLILEWNGRMCVPDLKATHVIPRTVGPQSAAYAEALYEMRGGRGRRPERYCIHLKPDGTYRSDPRRDPADFSTFVSCLNVYRYLEKAA